MSEITIDSIMDWLAKVAKEDIPTSPKQYLDAITQLVALQGSLDNEIVDLQSIINEHTHRLIDEGHSVAAARVINSYGADWAYLEKLKAKQKRLIEMIR